MSQIHARSAGENTCREVKVRNQVYSNVRYSEVVDPTCTSRQSRKKVFTRRASTRYLLSESLAQSVFEHQS